MITIPAEGPSNPRKNGRVKDYDSADLEGLKNSSLLFWYRVGA
jgi:hypothetical protein